MARNMILRLGIDASDFQKKMAQAGASAESTGKRIKKSMSMEGLGSEVAKIMGWSGAASGVSSITSENIGLARNQLSMLKTYREQLADAGFDDYHFGLVSERIKALEYDLDEYTQSLNRAADAEREASREADNLGDQSAKTEVPVSKASRTLREMSNSGRRLSIIPGFLRRIRDSAKDSNGGLEKMVRTIRNVSVVSFGLRLVRGLFGELGTVVRNYVSQDAQLQAQVNGLSASLGNALAPAIHLVTGALSYVLPYIVGVSNAIGQLMGALFGTGWSAGASGANKMAAATGGAAKAQKELNRQLMSFDQINKVESQKDTGAGGGGGAGSALAEIVGKTPAWMERFKASFTELFNSSEFQSANIGGKLGMILQTGIDWLGNEGMRFDWRGVGAKLRENLDSFIGAGWGQSLFHTLGIYLGGFGEFVLGLLFPQWEEIKRIYNEQGSEATVEYVNGMMVGFLTRMTQWMVGVGSWINDNVVSPIVNWVSEGFSSALQKIPEYLNNLKAHVSNVAQNLKNAFSFEWRLPHLRLPHLQVDWDPVDNVLANFFGVSAFPRLSVQWFAKGGILDGAQIFGRLGSTLLGGGERGREAILPLDTNTGWMDVLANRIAQSLNVDSNGDVNATINLILDGDVLTTYVMKGLRRRTRAGTSSF